MHKKKELYRRIVITIAVLVCTACAIGYGSRQIETELSEQMYNSMKVVAKQNDIVLNRELMSKYHLLETVASDLRMGRETPQQMMEQLQDVVAIYGFKRIGFVDKDGIVYTTDGYEKDLSFRDFYKDGMQGKAALTEVLEDSIGEKEKINVFSIPYYGQDSETVDGVLFITFRNEVLRELIDFECFDGNGKTYIFNEEGDLIVASPDTDEETNEKQLEQIYQQKDAAGENAVAEKNAIDGGESSYGFFIGGSKEYYHCTATHLIKENITLYILTVVPETYLQELEAPFLTVVRELIIIMLILVVVGVTGFLFSQYRRDQILWKSLSRDRITGGDNENGFVEKMEEHKKESGYAVSLDLDNFKIINNTFGTQKGDEVICEIWQILHTSIRNGEVAAHVNGDNFLMFLKGKDNEEIEERIKAITRAICKLSSKMNIPHIVPAVGISYIACLEERELEYGKANRAKEQIKGRRDLYYAFFNEESSEKIEEEKRMEDDFETSIAEERFEVWYQPKVAANGEKICGAEALVRWRGKDGKLISPQFFIPLFEKNGMISRLDEYVMDHVCRQQKAWVVLGLKPVPVSVNISRASLYFDDIAERYEGIVKYYQLNPELIQLEITESALMENQDVEQLILQFQEKGFKMDMDDFGHGYSSMALLSKTRFDVLKLDKSLIDGIGDKNGEILLESLISLAQKMGLSIVAEGVETKEQADFIWGHACNAIQGYYYYKPMKQEEYEEDLLNQ